jgi:hypothetical protein
VYPAVGPFPEILAGEIYFSLLRALMHFVQDKTLFPAKGIAAFGDLAPFGTTAHCRFGYFLNLWVGLNLPLNLTNTQFTVEVFPQISQTLDI